MSFEIKSIRQFKQLLEHYNCLNIGCEVGVAEGRSSLDFLSMGLTRLYMVDAWTTLDQTGDGGFPQEWHEKNLADAKKRVEPFDDKAVFLRGISVEMVKLIKDNSLDFVYIDANHSYEGCLQDLVSWTPKIKESGIVALHDYKNPAYGVNQAVQDFCKDNNYIIHDIPEESDENAGCWFQKI